VPLHERGTGVSLRPASDFRIDRIGSALRGENPTVLARMPGGFACMGDTQWLPGYCVLLTDDPDVGRLSDLPRQKRLAFLESMSDLGEAVERACRAADPAFRRVNLEILGNTDAYLHTHVWPRYDWEPADRALPRCVGGSGRSSRVSLGSGVPPTRDRGPTSSPRRTICRRARPRRGGGPPRRTRPSRRRGFLLG